MGLESCPAPSCIKGPISASTKCLVGSILTGSDLPSAMANVEGEDDRFIVAFCGSGTGHLTQAMKVVEMLKERGQTLAGVVTDSDASDKMLNEMVRPLGVEILIIPAIELVDTEKGFVPLIDPVRFVSSLLNSQESLHKQRENYAAFFARARAGIIYDMYHLTLARYLQLNPLPPSMRIVHMAAQFGLCELTEQDTNTFIEVGSKAVMDIMRTIFVASGDTIPISPLARDNVLPPIIHVPTALKPQTPRLILCYFLVRTNAERLDELLAAHPMPDVEFHCFTAKPLDAPRSQLRSHEKQRKLFQELFARCTGVIVSAGNETVWEAVSRGVPVLTIPTEGHGEQLLNAAVHARNFPNLVQARPRLEDSDIRWIAQFNLEDPGARRESAHLRERVTDFNTNGSPLLGGMSAAQPESTAAALKRRVSDVLASAKSFVAGGS